MNLTGMGGGATGRGQWPGAGSTSLTCNPRKFSEKIALHTQRQAEDIAAFREVMMDITSTRMQAQKVRHARSLASYYGGSLPNVNQISTCATDLQQHGQRDHRAGIHGRPIRRHADWAPYISSHFSPPSGPSCRRNWSSRSANEKSRVDQQPVMTLSRTRSDSALHTSVRMTNSGDPTSAQIMSACSRNNVPLIEENIQDEGKLSKLQKVTATSGSGASENNISGSLPDLTSLCLPSTVAEISTPELSICTESSTWTQPLSDSTAPLALITESDFSTPTLSSCLLAVSGNPLLQSSLSNPNLQTTLSSQSLRSSLSSTSLCPSLSSSSLKSSLSSQSLQSCFSSSSLSNQSVRSTASSGGYSSGIGESRSCSSTSLSCSPCAGGQVTVLHSASSRRKNPLSPFILPGGEESHWQLSNQFSPTMSTTLSSITQGVPLDTSTKTSQELKPLAYPCMQLSSIEASVVPYPSQPSQMVSHHQSEEWDLYKPNTRQQCQHQGSMQPCSVPKHHANYMQLQNPAHKAEKQLGNPYNYPPQKTQTPYHCYQQTQINPAAIPQPLQLQQQYQQCWNPQIQPLDPNLHQSQYQNDDTALQYRHQTQSHQSTNAVAQPDDVYLSKQEAEAFSHMKELSKLQFKKSLHGTGRGRTVQLSKTNHTEKEPVQFSRITSKNEGSNKFKLSNESYNGLNLTPSQTEALSQKLGQLQNINRISDSKCHSVEERDIFDLEHRFFNTSGTVPPACLDVEITDLPFSVPELDLESFALLD